ncbi:MAG: hypothetical protein AAGA87_08160 [Pseudomonadota bacterium]
MARRAKKRTPTAPEAEAADDIPEVETDEAVETSEVADATSADLVEVSAEGAEGVEAESPEVADEPHVPAEDEITEGQTTEDEASEPDRSEGETSEEVTDPVAEDKVAPDTEVAEEKKTSPGLLIAAMLLGGAVSAALGFVAARYVDANEEVVEGPTAEGNAALLAEQSAALEAALAEIDALKALDLEAPAKALVTPVDARVAQATERLDFMSEQLGALTERVETIAMRPTATGINADEFDGALSEFRDQLNAAISDAQTEITEAREEATRISEDAFSAEQNAMVRAAWAQVTAALESGEAYADSLATLEEIGGVEVPPAIQEAADEGVPTLAALQQAFPAAARDALRDSRSETGAGMGDGFMSFLREQTGARSLSPRDGDDPDAVLSRAEAAVREGDIATALTEAQALPASGRDALAAWEALAQARSAALEAAAAVSAELNSN